LARSFGRGDVSQTDATRLSEDVTAVQHGAP
jgi:hypothetical protein